MKHRKRSRQGLDSDGVLADNESSSGVSGFYVNGHFAETEKAMRELIMTPACFLS